MKNTSSANGAHGIRADGNKIQVAKNVTDGNGLAGPSAGSGVFVEKENKGVRIKGNDSNNNSNFGYELEAGGNPQPATSFKKNTGTGNANGLCSPNLSC